MKTWIFVLSFLFLFSSFSFADVLSTTSDVNFTTNVEKEIRVTVPDNCSAINGQVTVSNGSLVSISEEYPNKDIAVNGDKFIIYGLNQEVMAGDNCIVKITVPNNSQSVVGITSTGSTPDAQLITIDDFSLILKSIQDFNGDGVLNVDDVIFVIQVVFQGNAQITDLQKIITAVINEME